MEYKLLNGVLDINLVPNYNINNEEIVVALSRNLTKKNYDSTIISYYSETSDLIGINYTKEYKDGTGMFYGIRNKNNNISYEYQYKVLENGELYDVRGTYNSKNEEYNVLINKNNSTVMFRIYKDESGSTVYEYKDDKLEDSESYIIRIKHNEETNETDYSFSTRYYSFEYTETKVYDSIVEDFYNDNNVVLTSENGIVYKGYYEGNIEEDMLELFGEEAEIEQTEKEEIPTEVEDSYEIEKDQDEEYEEITLPEECYQKNGHGPIYNYKLKQYIDKIEFYIQGLFKSFPEINTTILEKDESFIEEIKYIHPDIDFNKLTLNTNKRSFIEDSIDHIKKYTIKRSY